MSISSARPRSGATRMSRPGSSLRAAAANRSARVRAAMRSAMRCNSEDCRSTRSRINAPRFQDFVASSTSLATVFMLRAVPALAAGMRSLERPMPLG